MRETIFALGSKVFLGEAADENGIRRGSMSNSIFSDSSRLEPGLDSVTMDMLAKIELGPVCIFEENTVPNLS
jgi:hypothetical protein